MDENFENYPKKETQPVLSSSTAVVIAISAVLLSFIAIIAIGYFTTREIKKSFNEYGVVVESTTQKEIDEEIKESPKADVTEITFSPFFDEKIIKINNYEDVYTLLDKTERIKENYGIEKFSDEYVFDDSSSYSFGDSYSFHQEYCGYEVFCTQVRVSVDENKELVMVGGNYVKFSDFTPDFKNKEAILTGNTEFGKIFNENEMSIDSLKEVIYVKDGVPYSALVTEGYEIYIVDANTGDVLGYDSGIKT